MTNEIKDEKGVATMLTVHDVARMLNCSARTVYRLTDAGKMPRPVKLGALVRWPREVVEQWIAAGCPKTRKEVL
jgi:excisionase family DNA binding protein